MAHHAAEYGGNIFDAAKKTGIAAEELQRLHFAAQLSGVSEETVDKGLMKLNRTLAEAAAGKNKDALAFFRHAGIALRDAHGHIRTATDGCKPSSTTSASSTKAAVGNRHGKASSELGRSVIGAAERKTAADEMETSPDRD